MTDPTMALSDSFRRVAVYFGLAEDREYYDDDEPEIRERAPAPRREEEERPNVRRLQSSGGRRDKMHDVFRAAPARRDRRHLRRRLRVRAPHHPVAARTDAQRPRGGPCASRGPEVVQR